MTIDFAGGSQLVVTGLDVGARTEGAPLDFAGIDEFADVKESVWLENIRPGLSERGGLAWLTGTPDGRNHHWRLSMQAQEDTSGLWDFFTWPSADILDPEEIRIAKAELDEMTYKQEYEADFLDVTGRVFFAFDRDSNIERVTYDPDAPLWFCADFNVSPSTLVIAQPLVYAGTNPAVDRTKPITAVIDEIWFREGNTVRVCQEFLKRYGNHPGQVWLFGDSSGKSRHSSGVLGSDWSLIEQALSPVFGTNERQYCRIRNEVSRRNPAIRARINATNSRCRSIDGTVRLIVNPSARHLIEDFEGCTWNADGTDIDKRAAPMLSHEVEALGYALERMHPVEKRMAISYQL